MTSSGGADSGAATFEQIPWGRIVHFHGRADNVPRLLRQLDSGDAGAGIAAVRQLRRCLEHQDGVTQATGVAMPFIISALSRTDPAVQASIIDLLATCLAAARNQLDSLGPVDPRPKWEDLLLPGKLWPEYVSDEEDEALWEEPGAPDDFEAWAAVTVDQVVSARAVFERLAASATPSSGAAAQLLAQIDRPPEAPPAVSGVTRHRPWWRFW